MNTIIGRFEIVTHIRGMHVFSLVTQMERMILMSIRSACQVSRYNIKGS